MRPDEHPLNIDHMHIRTTMYATTCLRQELNPSEFIILQNDKYPWHLQQMSDTWADEHAIQHTVTTYNICIAIHTNCNPPLAIEIKYSAGYDKITSLENNFLLIHIE